MAAPPGSDLALMREQLLDLFDVALWAAGTAGRRRGGERNVEFGAAMAIAVNEWQCAAFCDPEPRLKASVQITLEHEASAMAEIERRAGDRRFAQVQHPAARAGAARAAPLPEDPRRLRRERLADLAASRRHQRPCLDRRRLAVLLP